MSRTYTMPEIYDIAFDFRDIPGEVDFLFEAVRRFAGREPKAAMELACGPAYHVREIARRGQISHGLDLEPSMVDYARKLVATEQLAAEIHLGDMRSFATSQRFDLVYILIASFGHLLTNEDILANLDCAAGLLNDGGLYIISTAHPRDFFGGCEPSLKTHWTMTRGNIAVVTDWGGSDEQFDPITEIDDVVISFTVASDSGSARYEFPERLRRCSLNTLEALVAQNGKFVISDLLGDFDLATPLSNDPQANRLIAILKKR